MTEKKKKEKPFTCWKCGKLFGIRIDHTLITDSLAITLKESHQIKCPHCNNYTNFYVDNKKEKRKN